MENATQVTTTHRVYYWSIFLLIGLILYSCRSKEPCDQVNSKPAITISDGYKVELEDTISVAVAVGFAKNWKYRASSPVCTNRAKIPYGYYVSPKDIDTLLQIGKDGGIRIYFAIDDDDTMRIVLAGVDQNGNDKVNAKKLDGSYDFSSPCPSICDLKSPLTECNALDIQLPTVNKRPVNLRDACQWTKNWRDKYSIPNECEVSTSAIVRSYWISKDVFEEINTVADNASGSPKNGAMGIYFGSPNIGDKSPIYLMLVPATLNDRTATNQGTRIFLAWKNCPGDNCYCKSPLAIDSIQ
jgi:hypothetical protein